MKMSKEEEEQLRTRLQTTVSLCVQHGLLTPDTAQRYHRSGQTQAPVVPPPPLHFIYLTLRCLPPALDADLRFALASCSGRDISGRCLVYVNKVVNAKRQVDSEQQPQPQVRAVCHLFSCIIALKVSKLLSKFGPNVIWRFTINLAETSNIQQKCCRQD